MALLLVIKRLMAIAFVWFPASKLWRLWLLVIKRLMAIALVSVFLMIAQPPH